MKKLFLLPIVISILFLAVGRFHPALALSPAGNYLELNGGYVKAATSSDSFSYTFDFSALIRPDSVSGKQIIFSIGDKTAQKPHYEVGINGGTLYVDYFYDANSRRYIATGNLKAGEWSQIEVYLKNHLENLSVNGLNIFHNSHEQPYNIKDLGPDIVLGSSYLEPFYQSNNFKGKIDNVVLNHEVYTPGAGILFTQFISWPLDEARGEAVAHDLSINKIDGTLVGGDSLIHFFGVLPSPTPISFGLPPFNWSRPVLPTLSFPNRLNPNPSPAGSITQPPSTPSPTVYDRFSISNRTYTSRPVLPAVIITPGTCPAGYICTN